MNQQQRIFPYNPPWDYMEFLRFKPTIKRIHGALNQVNYFYILPKEIWWYIKEYIFGNEYWRRRLIPSLKRITEWAGEYCHSSYITVRVINFTFDDEKILSRVNCRNIYRQCHLKEVEKEARPKDLPRGLEVDEYQYSIFSIAQWDSMFFMGGFIQGEEMGNTYGVRRNDAPAWVKKGPRPRCVCPLFDGFWMHHRLIFDIEKSAS